MADSTHQSLVPTLHHLTSSQSHRVLFMLEELQQTHGTEYKLVVHEREGGVAPKGLKEHYPLGKSPLLKIEENGKPSTKIYQLPQQPGVLTESRLILQFLSDTFGQGMWVPQSDEDKAQDLFMQEFANNTLATKCLLPMIFELIPTQLPVGLKQLVGVMFRPVVSHCKKDLKSIYQLMEDALSDERPWFAGSKMGLADFNMMWGMDISGQRKYLDPKQFPKVHSWYERVTSRPAYKRAIEKGGVYNLLTA